MAEDTTAPPVNVREENVAGRDADGRFIHVGDIREKYVIRAQARVNQGDRLPSWSNTRKMMTPMPKLKADGSNLNTWMKQLQYRFFLLEIDSIIDTPLRRPLPSSPMREEWERWSRWACYWMGTMISEDAKRLIKSTMGDAPEAKFADDFLEDIKRCIKADDSVANVE